MQVELAPDVVRRLRRSLRKSGAREIGGMLLANQLSEGHFRVIDFSVDVNSGSSSSFLRDPTIHRNSIETFFKNTDYNFKRFNYLGEWHSHPSFSVTPSQEDIQTMIELVECGPFEIDFAILLIVRLRYWIKFEYSITGFVRGHPPTETQFGACLSKNR